MPLPPPDERCNDVRSYYRAAIWLPLALPAACWLGVHAFGMPIWNLLASVVALLVVSLLYGGIPYLGLAAWATWRARTLDEEGLRRLAWRSPSLMVLAFLPCALVVGALHGEVWLGGASVFAIGAAYILGLGYCYVALVIGVGRVLRRYFGRPPTRQPSSVPQSAHTHRVGGRQDEMPT